MHRGIILLGAVGATVSATAVAQITGPQASTPSGYRSAFEDYRPFREQALAPWRDINAEVARVGGHAGSLKPAEAGSGTVPGTPRPAGAAAPAQRAPAHREHQ